MLFFATIPHSYSNRMRTARCFLALLIVLGSLGVGCSTPPQLVISPKAGQMQPPRKLVVFMDGTANNFESRTNVRRLFELVANQQQPDILAYYDEGVGEGWHPLTGSLVGYGFSQNVREAATFLAKNYKRGDKIYVFGFSRGAYQALDLCGFVGSAGLPQTGGNKVKEDVKRLYSKYRDAIEGYKRAQQKQLGVNPTPKLRMQTEAAAVEAVHPPIEILGLWDAVEALGLIDFFATATGGGQKAEAKRQRGHKSHYVDLGPHIRRCYYALSLDERRQNYMAEIPLKSEGEPEQYEFVWFAGDHSDVGGGHHKDKDLAGASLNWMLERVGQDLLPVGSNGAFRVHENASARRHDLAAESWLMSLIRKRVRGEVFSDADTKKIDDGVEVRPARSSGWTMQIHESVLRRMESGEDEINGKAAKKNEERDGVAGRYVPRPFRQANGWVNDNLSAEEVRRRFPIAK